MSSDPPFKNRAEFFKLLQDLHQKVNPGQEIKAPTLGHRELDLYQLYQSVTQRGGVKKIIENKQWANVVKELKLPTTCTNAAFALRTHYIRYLFIFERKYLHGIDVEKEDSKEFQRQLQILHQINRPAISAPMASPANATRKVSRPSIQKPVNPSNSSNGENSVVVASPGRRRTNNSLQTIFDPFAELSETKREEEDDDEEENEENNDDEELKEEQEEEEEEEEDEEEQNEGETKSELEEIKFNSFRHHIRHVKQQEKEKTTPQQDQQTTPTIKRIRKSLLRNRTSLDSDTNKDSSAHPETTSSSSSSGIMTIENSPSSSTTTTEERKIDASNQSQQDDPAKNQVHSSDKEEQDDLYSPSSVSTGQSSNISITTPPLRSAESGKEFFQESSNTAFSNTTTTAKTSETPSSLDSSLSALPSMKTLESSKSQKMDKQSLLELALQNYSDYDEEPSKQKSKKQQQQQQQQQLEKKDTLRTRKQPQNNNNNNNAPSNLVASPCKKQSGAAATAAVKRSITNKKPSTPSQQKKRDFSNAISKTPQKKTTNGDSEASDSDEVIFKSKKVVDEGGYFDDEDSLMDDSEDEFYRASNNNNNHHHHQQQQQPQQKKTPKKKNQTMRNNSDFEIPARPLDFRKLDRDSLVKLRRKFELFHIPVCSSKDDLARAVARCFAEIPMDIEEQEEQVITSFASFCFPFTSR